MTCLIKAYKKNGEIFLDYMEISDSTSFNTILGYLKNMFYDDLYKIELHNKSIIVSYNGNNYKGYK